MSVVPSLPEYIFTEKLGKGSYATVYKAYRNVSYVSSFIFLILYIFKVSYCDSLSVSFIRRLRNVKLLLSNVSLNPRLQNHLWKTLLQKSQF